MNHTEIRAKLLLIRNVMSDGRCPAGERAAAETMYIRLLNKYGLSDVDIEQATVSRVAFGFRNTFERRLLHQLVAKVAGVKEIHYWTQRRGKTDEFELTCDQAEQVRISYKALCKSFARELERCLQGFIQANNLGVGSGEKRELTEEELSEIRRILRLAQVIDPTVIPEIRKDHLLEVVL